MANYRYRPEWTGENLARAMTGLTGGQRLEVLKLAVQCMSAPPASQWGVYVSIVEILTRALGQGPKAVPLCTVCRQKPAEWVEALGVAARPLCGGCAEELKASGLTAIEAYIERYGAL